MLITRSLVEASTPERGEGEGPHVDGDSREETFRVVISDRRVGLNIDSIDTRVSIFIGSIVIFHIYGSPGVTYGVT